MAVTGYIGSGRFSTTGSHLRGQSPVSATSWVTNHVHISRQHLSRRHMLSFRCQTCWRSFDAKAKREEHVQSASCRERPRPDGERFMDASHESEIDSVCSSKSEEDAWWNLFRLLIPGMETTDDASLYYPCRSLSNITPLVHCC